MTIHTYDNTAHRNGVIALGRTNQHIADVSEILWQTVERMFSEALDSNAISN